MNEAEAERQFLADLEKAKALSMESQALEEFRYKDFPITYLIKIISCYDHKTLLYSQSSISILLK